MSSLQALSLSLLIAVLAGTQSTRKQWTPVTDGLGIPGILINHSTESDVMSRFGNKPTVTTKNEYSRRIDYPEAGLAFYYCLKDQQKRIFLIEVHHGITSKGIVIGQSTLKDLYDLYGEEDARGNCDSRICVYEYKGVQFYVETPPNDAGDTHVEPWLRKVVEVDVVALDKSSNFCDQF